MRKGCDIMQTAAQTTFMETEESDLEVYRTFANRIAQAINDDGRSYLEIARASGVQFGTMVAWMQGRRRFDISLLVKLADELCISIDWALGRKDDQRL